MQQNPDEVYVEEPPEDTNRTKSSTKIQRLTLQLLNSDLRWLRCYIYPNHV